jgi:hypothetical protein
MDIVYAVIFQADAWRLFRGGAEIASFTTVERAERAGRRAAAMMSGFGFETELLLQDRFGELLSERFAGPPELPRPDPRRQVLQPRAAVLDVH